jgi:GNAT superfamily N-acetyltransferase
MIKAFKKWRNPPPFAYAPFLTDKYNKKFWIEWGEGLDHLDVFYRKQRIGEVNLLRGKKNAAILADIIIFSYPKKNLKLRGRGIGRAMLQETIRYAKKHEIKRIVGAITPDEYTSEAYLAEWYQRQGFEVYEEKKGHYEIRLELEEQGEPS